MSTQVGTQTVIGHGGTVTPLGGSAIECIIASFEPTHEWDTTEIMDGGGELTGLDARNERLVGRLTCQPYKSAGAPTLYTTPAPYTTIVLAGFAENDGTTAGRSAINGRYYYKGNFSYKEALGAVVEFSMDLWQGESIPAQS